MVGTPRDHRGVRAGVQPCGRRIPKVWEGRLNVHGPAPEPDLHRPETPAEVANPHPVVANEPGEEVEMLVKIKNSDALAKLAGMDPEALARIKEQEWKERHP
jgi:hypothetical protein